MVTALPQRRRPGVPKHPSAGGPAALGVKHPEAEVTPVHGGELSGAPRRQLPHHDRVLRTGRVMPLRWEDRSPQALGLPVMLHCVAVVGLFLRCSKECGRRGSRTCPTLRVSACEAEHDSPSLGFRVWFCFFSSVVQSLSRI